MRSDTSTILNLIDTFLADAPEDAARELWTILSATRGPDGPDINKTRTTAVVRALAFPKATKASYGSHGDDLRYTQFGAEVNVKDRKVYLDYNWSSSHFGGHLRHAAKVLGIPCFYPGDAGYEEEERG